ncbi:hypothetical protein HK104_001517 [Borealophlyctis nickersoniae]|nr:hypothetical protein HK104_001517 [Borealophlyctis nickersoniae]
MSIPSAGTGPGIVSANVIALSGSNPVKQVHVVQYQPTERPIEDRFNVSESGGRVFVGVFDGHHGPATAEYISYAIPTAIFSNPTLSSTESLDTSAAVRALSDTFESVDKSIISSFQSDFRLILPLATSNMIATKLEDPDVRVRAERAKSGSTALGVYVVGGVMYTVNVGDCRAGYMDEQAQLITKALTKDLNTKSSAEVQRLRLEHPGEEQTVIMQNRVLGRFAVTRCTFLAAFLPSLPFRALIPIMIAPLTN